jgi:inositol-phosphate transport system ATP-binding protein
MARIELEQISKEWGAVTALEPTDLSIADGEFVAVLGPSGCGKSTLLFMLAGIYTPTGGTIRFDGQRVNAVEAKDRNIGIVFQSYALYPHMSVKQNIMFPLKFKNIERSAAEKKACRAAELVHVADLLDRNPSQISGGQQQRVALARALVKEPQMLLLDEPLSNLDASLRHSMRSEIKALQRRLNVTTILVTHDQIEAITMANRIICMSKGRIEQIGTAHELYNRPRTLFVAKFIGAPPINLFGGIAADCQVRVNGHELALEGECQGDVVIGIRPEDLVLADSGLPGKLGAVEPLGREQLVVVDTDWGQLRTLLPGAAVEHEIGEHVFLQFPPEKTLVFSAKTEALLPENHVRLTASDSAQSISSAKLETSEAISA